MRPEFDSRHSDSLNLYESPLIKNGDMDNYKGTLIEESLENKTVLKKVKVLSTKVVKVAEKHKTPWLSQWTLHKIEIPENQARQIAEEISHALDTKHSSSWYVDFKNGSHHFIIFRNKIFFVDRERKQQYEEVKQYGISLGIPEYQLDFI